MSRKVIQITSAVSDTAHIVLTVLCDDGTIWQKFGHLNWEEIEIDDVEERDES